MKSYNFDKVYTSNRWGKAGKGSGVGSTIEATENIRCFIDNFIIDNKIQSILDLSCGRMNWWPLVLDKHPNVKFMGYDVSSYVIGENKKEFKGMKNWSFDVRNAADDKPYPKCDLLICRHTLQHLSITDSIKITQKSMNSDATYIGFTTHTSVSINPTEDNGIQLLPNTPNCFKERFFNLSIRPFNLGKFHSSVYDKTQKKETFAIWKI
jgi:hypothetical protein